MNFLDIQLSKTTDAFICLLYKNYLEKRKNGESLSVSRRTGSIDNLMKLLPDWKKEDIEVCCYDLSARGLLGILRADNTVWNSSFTEDGIIYMENRFKNKVSAIIDYLKDIKSFVPFV